MKDSVHEIELDTSDYLQQVRSYYDTMNQLYMQYVGKTYQAGLLIADSENFSDCASNLYFASQAGIQPGHHVLDAGCGICGPSIDICSNIQEVKIDCITLSEVQANTARKLVEQKELADRIQVHVGDYHHLPFANETFDVVLFLESVGYSYDYQQLFTKVHQVMRPGGRLYIKDIFRNEPPLTEQEQQAIAEFNEIYYYKTPQMSEMVEAISLADFSEIKTRNLSEIVNTEKFNQAMIESKNGYPILTEFGKVHFRQIQCFPMYFGEIKAWKV
ncbi:SAM-dependent methyltransferase [Nostoc sp. UIC 10890]